MTAFDPHGALLAAAALSLGGGLTACTAAPRYPVVEGEAAGGGLEPLQARYPVRVAQATTPAPLFPESPAAAPPAPVRETAPRAAPSGEVGATVLAPPPGAQPPPSPMPSIAAPRTAAPSAFSQPAPVARAPAASRSLDPPPSAATVAQASGSAYAAQGFIQRDASGQGRFTLGAPVPPPTLVAPPGPSAPTVYARPSPTPAFPPAVYARPSPSPSAPLSPYAGASAPPLTPYARPSTAPPTTYARPSSPTPGPGGLPGGPRPYSSVFSQGPARPVRSAGIRSTPSNPGIAPEPLSSPSIGSAPGMSAAEATSRGRGRFLWPLQGQLISGFGEKGGGQRNDGLNIAANLGDPVRAAAAGEVVYAGDQIPGSGKLVLVKHPGGWVTAYAHLSRIEVRMRDPIAQGQEIGQAGQTGAVDRPQLHFEIRYAPSPEVKAAPVDPAQLLPGG